MCTRGRHFFMKIKPALDISNQLKLLSKKGIIIDIKNPHQLLSNINYYRLSAYAIEFRKDNFYYKPGTKLSDIVKLYEFDMVLRSILFQAIAHIETSIKTKILNTHALNYGALGYKEETNFNSKHKHEDFLERIKSLIDKNKHIPPINHHMKNYGGLIPIWVVFELLPLGSVSRFYSDMLNVDRRMIAKEYAINLKVLSSWLKCLTELRNATAHGARIYNLKFKSSLAGNMTDASDRNTLWGYLLMLKHLFPSNLNFDDIVDQLSVCMSSYGVDYLKMGFPVNWKEIIKQ